MLVTEGNEHSTLKTVMASKDTTNRKIHKSAEITKNFYQSPRLVPTEFDPQCIETFIKIKDAQAETSKKSNSIETIETIESEMIPLKPIKSKKSTKLNGIKKDNHIGDVRQYFKPIALDKEDEEAFDTSMKQKPNQTSIEYIDLDVNEPNFVCTTGELDKISDLLRNLKNLKGKLINGKDKNEGQSMTVPNATNILNSHVPNSLKKFAETHLIESICPTSNEYRFDKIFDNLKMGAIECTPLELLHKDFIDQANTTNNQTAEPIKEDISIHITHTKADIDDLDNSGPIFIEIESKYADQFEDEHSLNKFNNFKSSTPLKKNTPSPLNSSKRKNNKSIEESPLAKAFQRSFEKQKKKSINMAEIFQYLGLNDIFDLFAQDEEEQCDRETNLDVSSHPLKISQSKEINNPSPQIKNKLIEVTTNREVSDMFRDDTVDHISNISNTGETQQTVSQIINIVHADESITNQTNKNTQNESRLSVKHIDIGTFDDLWASDEDIFAETISECNKNIEHIDFISSGSSKSHPNKLSDDIVESSQNCDIKSTIELKLPNNCNKPRQCSPIPQSPYLVKSPSHQLEATLLDISKQLSSPTNSILPRDENIPLFQIEKKSTSQSSLKENETPKITKPLNCNNSTIKSPPYRPKICNTGTEKSPSILDRKINLSKLKMASCSGTNGIVNKINSEPILGNTRQLPFLSNTEIKPVETNYNNSSKILITQRLVKHLDINTKIKPIDKLHNNSPRVLIEKKLGTFLRIKKK